MATTTNAFVALRIAVQPWGAVYLDGRLIGNTPVVRELRAAPGEHTVRVVHPMLGERSETVVFGRARELTVDLTKR